MNLAFYAQFLTLEFKAWKLRLPYEQGVSDSHLKIDGPAISSDIIMQQRVQLSNTFNYWAISIAVSYVKNCQLLESTFRYI